MAKRTILLYVLFSRVERTTRSVEKVLIVSVPTENSACLLETEECSAEHENKTKHHPQRKTAHHVHKNAFIRNQLETIHLFPHCKRNKFKHPLIFNAIHLIKKLIIIVH